MLLNAKCVYDGEGVTVPEEMGTPRNDQMQGTILEQLVELSGRVCYDSLGRGRSSEEYHQHILDVGHHSVLRHANVTFALQIEHDIYAFEAMMRLVNVPGIWLVPAEEVTEDGERIWVALITANLQSLLEARQWIGDDSTETASLIPALFDQIGCVVAPSIFASRKSSDADYVRSLEAIRSPTTDEQCWISMFVQCSRNCSHEFVRHTHRCAPSQRSTRYCDETETGWVVHPLLQDMWDSRVSCDLQQLYSEWLTFQNTGRKLYDKAVGELQNQLVERGADKLTSRKQARGAARQFLGTSLQTELIFSASVAQWRRMLLQRLTDAADAEIRSLFAMILEELKQSRYGERFGDMEVRAASDGIGVALK